MMDPKPSPQVRIKGCCVPGCKDRTSMRHRFPLNDPERFKIWRQNIGSPKLEKMTNEQIYKGLMVCRSHFIPMFHVPGTKMLHRRAIPTELLPAPPAFTSIPETVPATAKESSPPAPTVSECPPSKVLKGFPQVKIHSIQMKSPGTKMVPKVLPSELKDKVSKLIVADASRQSCAVPGCRPKDSSQFRFPHPKNGKQRFQKWLEIIKNPALSSLSPELIYKNRRVCGRHFEPEYFLEPNKLKYGAIPTLFVPDPEAAKDWNYSKSTDCQPAQRYSPDMIIQRDYDDDNAEDVDSAMPGVPMPNDPRCRICLTIAENAIPLSHSTKIDGGDSQTMCEILKKCCPIEIALDDNKPQIICIDCVEKARAAYEFYRCCENSESILQNELLNNDEEDPNTILCYIDVKEFEKIDKMYSDTQTPTTAPAKQAQNRQTEAIDNPHATEESKIYTKCEEPVNFRLLNVRTKQNLILSKRCVCMRRAKGSDVVNVKKTTVCVQCCRNFSRYARFKLYTKVLIGKKRYRCVKCGAHFASPRNFNLHLVTHKDILRYDYPRRSFLSLS